MVDRLGQCLRGNGESDGGLLSRTLRKLMACSRVVLVKLTKLAMASSGGSLSMVGCQSSAFEGVCDR